ncbi:hypothetical protein K504DRAFT_457153 [Pleomassaria siparia CBS 279.74]|uniref:Uncharacterized protein n=1 Tax=Pleomassaria siparia CBS 279.74 TaxID=1314801 RepID=A0A6G1KQY7_9PLEO|nr:hypothetical protein K504DRAFT_457153 [Pleomassaria siparia CBS 279.74]
MVNPFRFLDLPKDIRLEIYELLYIGVRHRRIKLPRDACGAETHITLVLRSIQSNLINTCTTIREEALAIRKRELKVMPRIIIHAPDIYGVSQHFRTFEAILACMHRVSDLATLHSMFNSKDLLIAIKAKEGDAAFCDSDLAVLVSFIRLARRSRQSPGTPNVEIALKFYEGGSYLTRWLFSFRSFVKKIHDTHDFHDARVAFCYRIYRSLPRDRHRVDYLLSLCEDGFPGSLNVNKVRSVGELSGEAWNADWKQRVAQS